MKPANAMLGEHGQGPLNHPCPDALILKTGIDLNIVDSELAPAHSAPAQKAHANHHPAGRAADDRGRVERK